MNDKFWYEDPRILIQENRLKEFIPLKEMTTIEKLNAIMRLTLYISFLLFITTKEYIYLYSIILVGFFSILIYNFQKENLINLVSKKTIPTKDNPFMNYNIITDPKNKPKTVNQNTVKKEINNLFNNNLYRDVSDLYQKNNSQRQFYTMPCTDIVNEQTKFAKWLYYTDETCKEKGIKCTGYN